jgi:hypothetical protein
MVTWKAKEMQYIVKVDCMEISCGKRRIKLVQDYF